MVLKLRNSGYKVNRDADQRATGSLRPPGCVEPEVGTLQLVAYEIRFSESAEEHFAQLTARERSIVVGAIRTQLRHEPLRETRNRKPLRPNPLAPWEFASRYPAGS